MKIDIIILSWGKTKYLQNVTTNAVNTLLTSEYDTEIDFNIVVVESNLKLFPFQYENTKTIYLKNEKEFNYNRFCNIASKEESAPYIGFFNNDVEFGERWATNLIYYMRSKGLESASPYSTYAMGNKLSSKPVLVGKRTRKELLGWAIVVKREMFERIGGFDERVKFYCSDNIYEEQLKKHNIRHGLIMRSFVEHIGNHPSIMELSEAKKNKYLIGETKKFNRIFDKNILNYGK